MAPTWFVVWLKNRKKEKETVDKIGPMGLQESKHNPNDRYEVNVIDQKRDLGKFLLLFP